MRERAILVVLCNSHLKLLEGLFDSNGPYDEDVFVYTNLVQFPDVSTEVLQPSLFFLADIFLVLSRLQRGLLLPRPGLAINGKTALPQENL